MHKDKEPELLNVAVYMVDRTYGGPEEGGWYYDYGVIVDHPLDGIEPSELVRLFAVSDLEGAQEWRNELQDKLNAGVNKGRRGISSVLSAGRYEAIMGDGLPVERWPMARPYYE